MVHSCRVELPKGIAYRRLVHESHYHTTRVLLLGLRVKHLHGSLAWRLYRMGRNAVCPMVQISQRTYLTLRAQPIALLH